LCTNRGDSLSYTHEIDDKGMTSWFGPKGSPTFFKARWIDDDTLTGAWEWPGRGYKLTLSRAGARPKAKGWSRRACSGSRFLAAALRWRTRPASYGPSGTRAGAARSPSPG